MISNGRAGVSPFPARADDRSIAQRRLLWGATISSTIASVGPVILCPPARARVRRFYHWETNFIADARRAVDPSEAKVGIKMRL
jgi:hypothetical protein